MRASRTARGGTIEAIAYVAERRHPSFAGRLPMSVQARLIRAASGVSGPNLHYLINTVRHLDALGLKQNDLSRLVALAACHLQRRQEHHALHRATRALIGHCVRHRVVVPLMRRGERRRFIHRMQMAQWALRDDDCCK